MSVFFRMEPAVKDRYRIVFAHLWRNQINDLVVPGIVFVSLCPEKGNAFVSL